MQGMRCWSGRSGPSLRKWTISIRSCTVVFHKSLPDKKFAEIKAVSGDLTSKAEAVTKATLSKRMEGRKPPRSRPPPVDMLKAAMDLETACRGDDDAAIEGAVLTFHAKYQALERSSIDANIARTAFLLFRL